MTEKNLADRYISIDDKIFTLAKSTFEFIDPGVYTSSWDSNRGLYLGKRCSEIPTDDIVITSEMSKKIIDQIRDFWGMSDTFKTNGLIHKRGFLLVGKPGCGKTSIIDSVIHDAIKTGCFVFIPRMSAGGEDFSNVLEAVKTVEPNKQILVIMEDFESFLERNSDKTRWLSILDGQEAVNNVVFLATSNYPEKIDERFTKRPSRFDTVYVINPPGYEDRLTYIKNRKMGIDDETAAKIAKDTDGMSYAQVKELLISVHMFKIDYEKSLDRLINQQEQIISSDDFEGKKMKIGFEGNSHKDDDCGVSPNQRCEPDMPPKRADENDDKGIPKRWAAEKSEEELSALLDEPIIEKEILEAIEELKKDSSSKFDAEVIKKENGSIHINITEKEENDGR